MNREFNNLESLGDNIISWNTLCIDPSHIRNVLEGLVEETIDGQLLKVFNRKTESINNLVEVELCGKRYEMIKLIYSDGSCDVLTQPKLATPNGKYFALISSDDETKSFIGFKTTTSDEDNFIPLKSSLLSWNKDSNFKHFPIQIRINTVLGYTPFDSFSESAFISYISNYSDTSFDGDSLQLGFSANKRQLMQANHKK